MGKKFKGYLFLLTLAVFCFAALISAAPAVSPLGSTTLSLSAGSSAQIIFQISTSSNQTESWQTSKNSSWVSFSPQTGTIINTDGNKFTSATISIPSDTPSGNYAVNLEFQWAGNNSVFYSQVISIAVTNNQQNTGSCHLNPSLTSYTQQVQQGQTFSLPQVTFSPSGCTVAYDSSHIYVEGGVVSNGIQKPVYISSMGDGYVNLNVDTTGLTSNTNYNTFLDVNTGNQTSKIPITIIVTGSSTPLTNITTYPTCSLDNTQYPMNSTGTLTCTNLVPGVTISVRPNSIIEGNVPSITSTQETWTFEPLEIGNTNITVDFYYQGIPVGKAVNFPIRITQGSLPLAGTLIKVEFFPELDQLAPGQNVTIQAVDNNTGNVLQGASYSLNGADHPGNIFSFQAKTNYTLRITSNGYNDYVQTIYLDPKYIDLNILAPNGFYSGKQIYVNSTPENATLYLDDSPVNSSFTASAGNHTLKATADGYLDTLKDFQISPAVTIVSSSLWQKGKEQTFKLNQVADYMISYAKDATSPFNTLASGTNDTITFTPNDAGVYSIQADGQQIYSNTIDKAGISSTLLYSLAGGILGLAVLITIILVLRKKKSGGYDSSPDSLGRESLEFLE